MRHTSPLAGARPERQARPSMDCDDVMLELAKMMDCAVTSQPLSAQLAAHVATCEACEQLASELAHEAEDELLGETIGAYCVENVLGEGGMGRVYLATHPEIHSRVAIKVFSLDWNAHPKLVSRFFAEARATNLIGHENIVNVIDIGRLEDGRPFMIMEYLQGQPLSALVGSPDFSDADVKRVMLDVFAALSAAHEHNIVHRDLKPDNIFVSPVGRATLLDFGIAKLISDAGQGAPSSATATGLILGTPQYMSPEQATGEAVDQRTDVYAAGIILYECFTGSRPFEGSSLYRLLEQHVHTPPPSPRALRPTLSANLESLVLRALAKHPDDRYQKISEMRDALTACEVDAETGGYAAVSVARAGERTVTAETVREGGQGDVDPTPQSPVSKRRTVILAVATVSVIAALLGAWQILGRGKGARSASQGPDADLSSPVGVVPSDAGRIPLLDARPLVVVDAAAVHADASIAKPRAKRRGIAPISHLREATIRARSLEADAQLFRVDIEGLDMGGRVNSSVFRNHIYFDFVSPHLVERHKARTFGTCIVRVSVHKGGRLTAERMSSKCAKAYAFNPPQCSLGVVLSSGRNSGALPHTFEPTAAVLRKSSPKKAGPSWFFMIDGVNYSASPCP